MTKWFSIQAQKIRTLRQKQVPKSEETESNGHKLTMLLLPQELPPVETSLDEDKKSRPKTAVVMTRTSVSFIKWPQSHNPTKKP